MFIKFRAMFSDDLLFQILFDAVTFRCATVSIRASSAFNIIFELSIGVYCSFSAYLFL